MSVWRILAAILHLGELKFAKGGDATKLTDAAATASAAAALGMTVEKLSAALVVRTITVRGQTTRIPLSPHEARDGADALAKALYDRLFKWLVKTMNEKLSADLSRSNSYIGILDIFGFENFKVNSFEQLNINYANEKLQQQFNHALFELEQREYVAEGVQWNMVEFADGRDCVELIEDKRGIIALLDEQCRLQQSTDATLIDKLHEQLASRPKYVKPRLARGEFGVRHYAGEVAYQVAGFIDKNRDTLPRHFLPLLLGSDDKLIGHLFAGEADDADAQARQTVGGVFKKQLADLMAQLATTHCSYIRCLKPNADKAPEQFVGSLVAEQLRYSGMLETIRIRKLGYGRRFLFADFAGRYAVMLTVAERAASRRRQGRCARSVAGGVCERGDARRQSAGRRRAPDRQDQGVCARLAHVRPRQGARRRRHVARRRHSGVVACAPPAAPLRGAARRVGDARRRCGARASSAAPTCAWCAPRSRCSRLRARSRRASSSSSSSAPRRSLCACRRRRAPC
jgi:myosin X